MSENKVVVTRWAEEVLNRGKLDVVDELFADEFTWEMPFSPEPLHGPQAMKETVAAFLEAFSDFHVDVEDVLGEGDKVALKYTASGTNDGEFQGTPPTGKHAGWHVQHVFTLRDGKIVADVTVLDRLGLLEQLGLSPATAGGTAMTSNATKPAGDLVVHLRRVLPASRERVYEALTNPDKLTRWWGPKGFSCPLVEFDPRVGGSYRIAMQPPEGELFYLSGEFRDVGPPTRLAYTFVWDPPAPDDQETLAELSLTDEHGGTEVILVQGPFATEERRKLHEDGWSEGLDRLREVLD